jgi:bile acid:Na+ symporter, BASS family
LSAIWAPIGNGTLIARTALIVAMLIIGHLLGARISVIQFVLALSNVCRHPSIAIAIASASVPDEQFGATILRYVLMNATVCIPYVVRPKRRMRPVQRYDSGPVPIR